MPKQFLPLPTLHQRNIRKPRQCLPTLSLVRLARILNLQSTCPEGTGSFTLSICHCQRHFRSLPKRGHLKPLEPRPLPKNLPTTHDAALYCAYHQQTGHATDNCFRLHHEVQDLIDNEVILPPTSAKSVTTQLLDFEDTDTASM